MHGGCLKQWYHLTPRCDIFETPLESGFLKGSSKCPPGLPWACTFPAAAMQGGSPRKPGLDLLGRFDLFPRAVPCGGRWKCAGARWTLGNPIGIWLFKGVLKVSTWTPLHPVIIGGRHVDGVRREASLERFACSEASSECLGSRQMGDSGPPPGGATAWRPPVIIGCQVDTLESKKLDFGVFSP